MDRHRGLVVFRSGEDLRFLGRNRRILLDQRRGDTTHGFDTERQRRHVQQQHVLDVTGQYRALKRGTHGNRLVRVYILAGLLAEKLRYFGLHHRHAGLATHQDHLVDIAGIQIRVLERYLHRLE